MKKIIAIAAVAIGVAVASPAPAEARPPVGGGQTVCSYVTVPWSSTPVLKCVWVPNASTRTAGFQKSYSFTNKAWYVGAVKRTGTR